MDLRANAIITAIDRFSGPVHRMAGAMNALSGRAAVFANATRRMGTAMSGPGSLGASMASGGFLATQLKFEEAMNRTQAVLDIQRKETIAPLRGEILRIAEAYPAMRVEIAKATTELAQSGMKWETVKAVLENTVRGAMASGESIANVGMGVTDVIMGMGMAFKTAAQQTATFGRVNDVMAAGATLWNQNYMQFLSGLTRGGPMAAAAKLSLEQLTVMLGIMANAGFKAERGGIAFSSSIMRIAAPTKQAREALRNLGIDHGKFVKQTGEFQGIGSDGLIANLEEELGVTGADALRGGIDAILKNPNITSDRNRLGASLNKVIIDGLAIGQSSTEDRTKIAQVVQSFLTAAFSQVDAVGLLREIGAKGGHDNVGFISQFFGKHHGGKMAALIRGFVAGLYDEGLKALTEKAPGATDRFAQIMMQGFVGAWHRLTSQFDALLERMAMSGVLDTVTNAFSKLTDALNRLGQTDPTALKWLTTGLLTIGVLGPIGMALSGIGSGLATIAAALALPGMAALIAAGGIAALLGAGDAFKAPWVEDAEVPGGQFAAAPIVETWNRLKALFGEVWELAKSIAGTFRSIVGEVQRLFRLDASDSLFIKGLRVVNEVLATGAHSAKVLRENVEAIKSGNFGGLQAPVKKDSWLGLSWEIVKELARRGSGADDREGLPPLAKNADEMIRSLQNWTPRVEGEAKVKFEPLRVIIDGVGRALVPEQQPAEATIPLRTGRSLGDIGAP